MTASGRRLQTVLIYGVVTLVLLSACASAQHPRPLAAPASANRTSSIVYFADLWSRDFVVVAISQNPNGGGVRLLATSIEGRSFRDIGPRTAAGELPDSLFILDRTHIWFLTADSGGGPGVLHRTRDGGRTWQAFPIPPHSAAAGSHDSVQFLDPTNGRLTVIQPSAPREELYETHNGGASWRLLAETHPLSHVAALPRLGFVRFEADATHAFLGGPLLWAGPLAVSRDGGRTWQPAAIPSGSGKTFEAPTISGHDLVEPVVSCSHAITTLRTYVSADDGRRWAPEPAIRFTTAGSSCAAVSISFPTPTSGWASTLDHGRLVVVRTTDGGSHWWPLTAPAQTASSQTTIDALDGSSAWLLLAGKDTSVNAVFVTTNSGHDWRRVDIVASR